MALLLCLADLANHRRKRCTSNAIECVNEPVARGRPTRSQTTRTAECRESAKPECREHRLDRLVPHVLERTLSSRSKRTIDPMSHRHTAKGAPRIPSKGLRASHGQRPTNLSAGRPSCRSKRISIAHCGKQRPLEPSFTRLRTETLREPRHPRKPVSRAVDDIYRFARSRQRPTRSRSDTSARRPSGKDRSDTAVHVPGSSRNRMLLSHRLLPLQLALELRLKARSNSPT